MTLNLAAFYYDYKGYQISQIVDRSAVNHNFDAKVWGLELEADWRPLENLRFGFKGGYENTRIADGEQAIDMMDRTAGRSRLGRRPAVPDLPLELHPAALSVRQASAPRRSTDRATPVFGGGNLGPCELAYAFGLDPVTELPYVPDPTSRRSGTPDSMLGIPDYPGFDPLDGAGQQPRRGLLQAPGRQRTAERAAFHRDHHGRLHRAAAERLADDAAHRPLLPVGGLDPRLQHGGLRQAQGLYQHQPGRDLHQRRRRLERHGLRQERDGPRLPSPAPS